MTKDFTGFQSSFFALVEQAQHVVITAHYSPDDDSIASVLSTYTILKAKYTDKDIRIVYTGPMVDRYNVFHHFSQIEWVDDIAYHLDGTDLLIVLDVNNLKRVSNAAEKIQVSNTICIDHHASAPDTFTLSLIDSNYSSNSELVYHALEVQTIVTPDLAKLFLLGILGDTGNLTHIAPHQAEVFAVVQQLVVAADVRIDSFLSEFRMMDKSVVPLLQEFVKNTTYIDIEGWPSMQYSFISRDFAAAHAVSDEEMSAASHIYMGQYLPRIKGQPWGVVFSPRSDGGVRMSSRSLAGSVNVRLLCESMGIGGGHDRASGANFKHVDGSAMEVADAIDTLFKYMQNNKPVLS